VKQSATIRCVLQMQVHDIETFKEVAAACCTVSSDEPGTLYYDWFLDETTGQARLVEGSPTPPVRCSPRSAPG
jgi:quinol monooxygenase YgiN